MRKAEILFVETFPNLLRNTNTNIRETLESKYEYKEINTQIPNNQHVDVRIKILKMARKEIPLSTEASKMISVLFFFFIRNKGVWKCRYAGQCTPELTVQTAYVENLYPGILYLKIKTKLPSEH